MLLFKTAMENEHYDYFHLMSGQDLPIKNICEINAFFEANKGKEFIGFFKRRYEEFADRVTYWHFFQEADMLSASLRSRLSFLFQKFQQVFHIGRNQDIELKKGPEWSSLTHSAVSLLLSKSRYIKRHFGYGFCADEIYKQTIIWNSPLRDNIYDKSLSPSGNLYLILWEGNGMAHPRIFSKADEEMLRKSDMLFARKFTDEYMFRC